MSCPTNEYISHNQLFVRCSSLKIAYKAFLMIDGSVLPARTFLAFIEYSSTSTGGNKFHTVDRREGPVLRPPPLLSAPLDGPHGDKRPLVGKCGPASKRNRHPHIRWNVPGAEQNLLRGLGIDDTCHECVIRLGRDSERTLSEARHQGVRIAGLAHH